MKFLIAASFLCIALVGQIQGGSLRGLTVPIPHQSYGAPLLDNEIHIEETKPIIEDKDTTVIESEPIVSVPSKSEAAFVDSLPLIDSVVNFGTPSDVYGPPAKPIEIKPQPELPYLEPGLPTLPEAPFVPEIIEEPVLVNEVSNAYLPPSVEIPTTTPAPLLIEEFKPSEVYGPPMPEIPKDSDVVEIPNINEIPALPEVPVTPPTPIVEVEAHQGYDYSPPAVVPVFDTPKVTVHAPELPVVKPEVLYGAPVITHQQSVAQVHIAPGYINSHLVDIPQPVRIPVESPKQGYSYDVPAKEFPTPLSVPVVHELVSHSGFVQNVASSSSNLQVNKFIVPSHLHAQTLSFGGVQPIGSGVTIHSVSGNSEKTSLGSFNQVSVVKHGLPHLAPIRSW